MTTRAALLRTLITLGAMQLSVGIASAQTPPTRPPASPPGSPPATAPGATGAQPGGRGGGGGGGRGGGIRIMTLTSTAFADGSMIPMKYSQAGHDVSPPLSWSGAPDSTRSFVLIVHDIDAALGDGSDDMLHWMVWNVPGTVTSLPEGISQGNIPLASLGIAPAGNPNANNGARQLSATGPFYRGPAAPSTGPAHHYVFEVYALDANVNVQATGQTAPPTRAAVMAAMLTHIRGKGVLVGLYKRPAP